MQMIPGTIFVIPSKNPACDKRKNKPWLLFVNKFQQDMINHIRTNLYAHIDM